MILLLLFLLFLAKYIIIYSFRIYYFFKQNYFSKNISIIRNSLGKDNLAITSLISANPVILISSESTSSISLSETSSDFNFPDSLSETSLDFNIPDSLSETSSDLNTPDSISDTSSYSDWDSVSDSSGTLVGDGFETSTSETLSEISSESDILSFNQETYFHYISPDSNTVLNQQTFEQWMEMAMFFHNLPVNSPAGILQLFKYQELKILFSEDLTEFRITDTELRLIIEHWPAWDLFLPEMNHYILLMMSYYHG